MKLSLGNSLFNSRFCALFCLQACALSTVVAQSPSPGGTPQAQGQTSASSGSITYTVTDLGIGSAMGINDLGQIVGGKFLWQNGQVTDLGTLPGYSVSYATAINNEGQIVGADGAFPAGGNFSSHLFLWQDGKLIDLGTLGGDEAWAARINDKGQIVGYSTSAADTQYHPVLWQDGKMMELVVNGLVPITANGINSQGQIVGTSFTGTGGFLWQDGKVTELGSLFGTGDTSPFSINDKGQVAGFSGTSEFRDAFLWQNGQMTDLGTLTGAVRTGCIGALDECSSSAAAINNESQVVGWSNILGVEGTHAFLWQDGKMTDLNDFLPAASGWVLAAANGINNRGQIVGDGIHNGVSRGFLLTPVHTVDADLQLSLPSWQFATHPIGETSGPGKIWIYNSGTQAADFNSIQFAGGDAQDFAITENTCGSSLAPFTTCKVAFNFTPMAVGERNASLNLNDNANDGPHVIPVRGYGSRQ
jgi:probable HAF family extracellular repeat protein